VLRRIRQIVCVAEWLARAALALSVAMPQGIATAAPRNAAAAAQSGASSGSSQPLAFDVVSIKQYGRNDRMIRIGTTPDGVSVRGMPMHMIVREAFGVTNDQLLGEPDWVGSNRYDFDAKVSPDDAPRLKQLSQTERFAMLLPVLEDRCQLKFHHETRELNVYTLVTARSGPKLQPSRPAGDTAGPGPAGQPKLPANADPTGMLFTGHAVTMASIARMISRAVGSPVIDKTGLTGKYDYTLSFAPDESLRASLPSAGIGNGAPPQESDGPSIFTALQEQLGLKLEAHKEPMDVIVIDHIEQPAEN
jgi:uncharacterized protein (TIGR03435 family)